MRSLDLAPYGPDQVSDALTAAKSGSREVRFRYERWSKENKYLGPMQGVRDAKVSHRAFADIPRTASLTFAEESDIDWLNDRVKPYVMLRMPDDGWVEWSLGLFLMSTTKRRATSVNTGRPVDAYDQTIVLREDKLGDRLVIAAGSNVVVAVNDVLAGAGITLRNITTSSSTLPVDREWEPGTSKAQVVNDLLLSINYGSLWFDADGYAIGVPYKPPSETGAQWSYLDDQRSTMLPGLDVSLDLFNVPNKWVVIVSEPDRPLLRAEYTNTNPDSPTSTVNRGRTIVDFRETENAVSQAVLDARVLRIAHEASQVYEYLELPTLAMPIHEHLDVLEVRFGRLGVEALFQETGWDLTLRAGVPMNHQMRRLVQV